MKRAVDDYHKSTLTLGAGCVKTSDVDGGECGIGSPAYVPLRRYSYKEYTFKNFEIFLYESLKGLQKSGTYSFQNISDVYKEVKRVAHFAYAAFVSIQVSFWLKLNTDHVNGEGRGMGRGCMVMLWMCLLWNNFA